MKCGEGQCKGNENICVDGKNENKAAITMKVSLNCFFVAIDGKWGWEEKKWRDKDTKIGGHSSYRRIYLIDFFSLFEESLFY